MIVILFSVVIFMLAVIGLATGVLAHRAPLTGSCGGCAKCLYRRGQP